MTTVLLVEDNPAHQEMVARSLSGHEPPYTIVRAATAAVALHHLDSRPIDVVLLDDTLPDAGTLRMLAEVQLRDPPPPVVILSEASSERDIVETMKRGAVDHLPKAPEPLAGLTRVIDRATETA